MEPIDWSGVYELPPVWDKSNNIPEPIDWSGVSELPPVTEKSPLD